MPKREISVTDHAVVRYLERAHGIDMTSVRNRIRSIVAPAAAVGASSVAVDGVKLALHHGPRYVEVLTVLPAAARQTRQPSKRGGSK